MGLVDKDTGLGSSLFVACVVKRVILGYICTIWDSSRMDDEEFLVRDGEMLQTGFKEKVRDGKSQVRTVAWRCW